MQENKHPFESGTGYYTITYIDEDTAVPEQELFDAVFSRLEKIQKESMLKRIKRAEAQLANIEAELGAFLENKIAERSNAV